MSRNSRIVILSLGDKIATLPADCVSSSSLLSDCLAATTTTDSAKSDNTNISSLPAVVTIPLPNNYTLAFDDYIHFCHGQTLTYEDYLTNQLMLANYLDDKKYLQHLIQQLFKFCNRLSDLVYGNKLGEDIRHEILLRFPYGLLSDNSLNNKAFIRQWLAVNRGTIVVLNDDNYYHNNEELLVEKQRTGLSVVIAPIAYKLVCSYCESHPRVTYTYLIVCVMVLLLLTLTFLLSSIC